MVRLPLRTGYELERSSPFGYRCGSCSSCCRNKIIPLNPYEVARLAEHLGLSTTETLARYTDAQGAILKPRSDGAACPFLGERGCGVHPARPLACRLYPLGRHVSPEGVERFAEVEPHPQSRGSWDGPGTVEDYLRDQGAAPFIAASDRYFALFRRMLEVLSERRDESDDDGAASGAADDPASENWLDVDAVVSRWCTERGIPMPSSVEERIRLHVEALIAALAGSSPPSEASPHDVAMR